MSHFKTLYVSVATVKEKQEQMIITMQPRLELVTPPALASLLLDSRSTATAPGLATFIPKAPGQSPYTQNYPQYKKTFHTTLAGTLAAVFSSILPSAWAIRREVAGSEAFSV